MLIPSKIVIILVEPQYRGNIGVAARVMNNFGLKQLRIVGSVPTKEDHVMAVHSEGIIDKSDIFDSLEDALFDIDNAIAVSRRSGRKKKVDLKVDKLGDYLTEIPREKTALVFGRETYGLKDEEAALCPIRCYIPTDESFGSLNLAQSVAIVSYELYRHIAKEAFTTNENMASMTRINEVTSAIVYNLIKIGYFQTGSEKKLKKQLDNILVKSYTNEENLYFLEQMFTRIGFLVAKKD